MRRLFAIDAYKHMNVLMTNDLYSRITTKNFSKMDLGLWLYMSPWCLDKLTKDWNEAQKVLAWIRETSMRTVSLCKLVEYICLSLSNKWKTWPIIVPIGLGKHPRERRRYASSSVLIVLTLLWYGSSAALFQLIWFKIRRNLSLSSFSFSCSFSRHLHPFTFYSSLHKYRQGIFRSCARNNLL